MFFDSRTTQDHPRTTQGRPQDHPRNTPGLPHDHPRTTRRLPKPYSHRTARVLCWDNFFLFCFPLIISCLIEATCRRPLTRPESALAGHLPGSSKLVAQSHTDRPHLAPAAHGPPNKQKSATRACRRPAGHEAATTSKLFAQTAFLGPRSLQAFSQKIARMSWGWLGPWSGWW